ncbi:MAG: dihydrodipicolinate synthase family protein [Acidobacteria bacterium]|nr:dihydrodipicolinate synthase family protein [Acidobacteriota bacterium]
MAPEGREWKEWAKEQMKGLENLTMLSFTPDLKIDEEGIRWDVQQAIRHGFFSTSCAAGGSPEQQKRILEMVVKEAAGKIHVSIMGGSVEQLKMAEEAGVNHATIMFGPSFRPDSEDEIYRVVRELCDSTKMGIVLYASERFDFARFHPSTVPFDLYDRLVDIPNVMAMKVGFPEPGVVYECFRRYGSRIQVNIGSAGMVGMFPLLVQRYQVQWGGTGLWESWQSPEKPYLVEFFDHVLKGRMDQAMKIYWFLAETNAVALQQLGTKHLIGGRDEGLMHTALGKYVTWTVGGNGGPTPGPGLKLTRQQMETRKRALRAIGITPREPDEEFFVGRVNYARLKQEAASRPA